MVQQAFIIREPFDDPAQRTALFAAMDFSDNSLTLVIQIFLTSRIVHRIGLGFTLAIVPLLLVACFKRMETAGPVALHRYYDISGPGT